MASTTTVAQRIKARIWAPTLDRQLAHGTPPEESVVLSLRAHRLTGAKAREELARQLRRLVDGPAMTASLGAQVPVSRRAVAASADELRRLASRLQAPAPVAVRGVAQAHRLLTDGRGPLYSACGAAELRRAIRMATAELDL